MTDHHDARTTLLTSMTDSMRIGLALPQLGAGPGPARAIARFATTAEQLGYDTLWVSDRLITPAVPADPYPGPSQPYPAEFTRAADPLLTWTVAATVTNRVRLNSSTLNGPYYSAVHLARALTTLDVLSEGRLDVGLGLGWMRDEYAASGAQWSRRGARLDDLLDLLQQWWTSDRVSHVSEFVRLEDVRVDLRPVQPHGPPIYLGGLSEPALARAGRRAVGWLTFDRLPADVATTCWQAVRRSAEQAGRDPDAVRRVVRLNPQPGDTVASVVERLRIQADAGAHEALVDLTFLGGTLDRSLHIAERLADDLGISPEGTDVAAR